MTMHARISTHEHRGLEYAAIFECLARAVKAFLGEVRIEARAPADASLKGRLAVWQREAWEV